MPEIAEIARVVHYLRKSLVGKTLSLVQAQDDPIVFGKVGTSGAEVQKALTGKKVLDVGRQGKYFWLIMSSPPHPVLHFGMTGWFYIKGEPTIHYRPKTPEDAEVWPPKYWKLLLQTDSKPPVYAAFTDARRLARIRLVDCAAKDIRDTTPLKENGPDPTLDQHILTEEWFEKKMLSKRVPVKALLLDQANISGIGNWVGDEILYHAQLHPEQYSNTFTSAELKRLHSSMLYVCQTAVDLLADSSKFPEEWLFKHRWGKGKKDAPKELPNGEKIIHLTVGGRTSCVVPSVQKKTGPAAADVKTECKEVASGDGLANPKAADKAEGVKKRGRGKTGSTKVEEGFSDEEEHEYPKEANPKGSRKRKMAPGEEVTQIDDTKALSNAVRRTTIPEQNEVETNTKHTSRVRSKRSKVIEPEPILQASDSKGTHSESTKDGGARRSGRVPKAKV